MLFDDSYKQLKRAEKRLWCGGGGGDNQLIIS